ncbi:protein related to Gim complex component GIM4 [Hirsutella rhossiliensis]|uniref:Proteinrelated to Gim complex component GIM4 n=1 Tax=Hirsutella rhossiliensis TaxID=111463 RepID=A0A9P8N3X0_9HYPO|nr:proteinrelated to Gim complex component GIM4 [Hirsutella rhossiliensis]KAH0967183.1 proteinrelated to Gim complex component GIM4 [Hirsutella rhossiliensis]
MAAGGIKAAGTRTASASSAIIVADGSRPRSSRPRSSRSSSSNSHRRRSDLGRPSRRLRNLLASDNEDDNAHDDSSGSRYQARLRLLRYRLRPDQRSSTSPDDPPTCRTKSNAPKPSPVRAPSMAMTTADFEALPPTVQRKYFSTLERLRINLNSLSPCETHTRRRRFDHLATPDFHIAPSSLAAASPRPRRRHSHEQLSLGRRRQSVILDATDEAYLRIGKRYPKAQAHGCQLQRATSPQPAATMQAAAANQPIGATRLDNTAESLYECFRWLEEDDTLDLRLFLDDYHFNLREEVLVPNKPQGQRPSFRRHLSISKLPFGGRVSGTFSRPETKDDVAPVSPNSPVLATPGHARRRSRALSLISPNKQSLPDMSAVMDPAASHYQDPEARMKLRVYLASPHKFDEAIEFGFPSIDAVQNQENISHRRFGSQESPKLQTFLEDDASSMYSDASAADPESPRTPETGEHARGSHDKGPGPKVDYAQAPASSREMTLRMTLTRPDLRSHEGQMYNWQKGSVDWRSQARDEPLSPLLLDPKESIERQLAAIDQEELANDNGVVRRFWNRVRRT